VRGQHDTQHAIRYDRIHTIRNTMPAAIRPTPGAIAPKMYELGQDAFAPSDCAHFMVEDMSDKPWRLKSLVASAPRGNACVDLMRSDGTYGVRRGTGVTGCGRA